MTNPGAGFGPVHLTTHREIPQRRAELAREVFGRQILRLDVEPVPNTDFSVDLTLRSLPGVKLITGWVNGASTLRTPSLLADGTDDVFFCVGGGEGMLVMEQRNQQVVLKRNSLGVIFSAERFAITHLKSRALGVAVPRRTLAALVPDLDDRIAGFRGADLEGVRLLQTYVNSLCAMESLDDEAVSSAAVTHIHDLLSYIIGPSRDGREIVAARGLKAARLQAIMAHIDRNLAGGDLSVRAVATAHRMTERYLQRLFEGEGATYSAYVTGQRLEHARKLLADPRFADRPISALAYECGFRDVSHFNRMFRRRYEATPSDLRGRPGQ